MGTTKLMHMKESKRGNSSIHLKNSIEYILQKCNDISLMGGTVSLDKELAFNEMMEIKNEFNKITNKNKNRRQGYHFVITLPPDEGTPEICSQIASEFCEEFLEKNKFQYIFATHKDRDHLHTHIIFNSVNLDGKMFFYKNGDWEEIIQPLVNKIALKYGCSEATLKKLNKEVSLETYERKNEIFNAYDLIRQDIDKAISLSESLEEFYLILEKSGYQLKQGYSKKLEKNYITFSPDFVKRSIRSYKLGTGYDLDEIQRRIKYREYDSKSNIAYEKMRKTNNKHLYKKWKDQPKVVRDQYKHNIELMKEWSNNTFNPFPNSKKIKQDLLRFDKIVNEYNYLVENKLKTLDDITDKKKYLESEIERLVYKRKNIYYLKYKGENKTDELKDINKTIKELNRENKIIRKIIDYSSSNDNLVSFNENYVKNKEIEIKLTK